MVKVKVNNKRRVGKMQEKIQALETKLKAYKERFGEI